MDTARKPAWLRARLPSGPGYAAVRGLVDEHKHTVCQSAQCPNLGECWSRGTADPDDPRQHLHPILQFLRGADRPADRARPGRAAARWRRPSPRWGWRHCVITSRRPRRACRPVARRCGAATSARSAAAIRRPRSRSLVPDFKGRVPRHRQPCSTPGPTSSTTTWRPSSGCRGPSASRPATTASRGVLRHAKGPGVHGQDGHHARARRARREIERTLRDLGGRRMTYSRSGQYLQPTKQHMPVDRWVTPQSSGTGRSRALDRVGRGERPPSCARATTPHEQSLRYTGEEHLNTRNALAGA